MLPRYEPMLATSWPEAFSDPAWRFEPKWDGVRVILSWDGDAVSMRSRRGTDVTARYPELHRFRPDDPCVLDGEVVALDESGRPSFERIQQRMNLTGASRVAAAMARVPVALVVFDVLHVVDRPVVGLALEERHRILDGIPLDGPLRRSEPVLDADGLRLWEAVKERDLEGMVAKRLGSPYRPGVRSADWRKIHNVNHIEVVVGGFTRGDRGRSDSFGALLVGLWDGALLRWVGGVGTGFSGSELSAVREALDQMLTDESPFHPADIPGEPAWVEPNLVARVGFRDWTSAGRLRHPRFLGFSGTPSEEVTWDAEGPEAHGQ